MFSAGLNGRRMHFSIPKQISRGNGRPKESGSRGFGFATQVDASGVAFCVNWIVWRQDDHGNRFRVSGHKLAEEAEVVAEEFTARGHKQHYWVEPESRMSGECSKTAIHLDLVFWETKPSFSQIDARRGLK